MRFHIKIQDVNSGVISSKTPIQPIPGSETHDSIHTLFTRVNGSCTWKATPNPKRGPYMMHPPSAIFTKTPLLLGPSARAWNMLSSPELEVNLSITYHTPLPTMSFYTCFLSHSHTSQSFLHQQVPMCTYRVGAAESGTTMVGTSSYIFPEKLQFLLKLEPVWQH